MSGNALGDLNMLPESVKKIESSSNGSFHKPHIEQTNENVEEKQRKITAPLVEIPMNGNETVSSVEEVASSEVEYFDSENLNDLEDVDTCLKTLVCGLESKDWVVVCEALNNVRRLSLFHKDLLSDMLGNVISLVVKSLKNPRSAVCKTAVMTSADIFKAYNDHMIDSLDPLLVQLLLKASQDKRFVCEAAERTLVAMTTWVSPNIVITKVATLSKEQKSSNSSKGFNVLLSQCTSTAKLKFHGAGITVTFVKAFKILRDVSSGVGVDGINTYGIDKLIHIAASQLSDQLPESREAARTILLELQAVYDKSHFSPAVTLPEDLEINSWEHFCQSNLSPLSAQAVLRVTGISREGLVLGS